MNFINSRAERSRAELVVGPKRLGPGADVVSGPKRPGPKRLGPNLFYRMLVYLHRMHLKWPTNLNVHIARIIEY